MDDKNVNKSKKRTVLFAIILVAIAIVLLIPIKETPKDGGSVTYRSVIYSYTNYHQLQSDGIKVGKEFCIFSFPIYSNTHIEPYDTTPNHYVDS